MTVTDHQMRRDVALILREVYQSTERTSQLPPRRAETASSIPWFRTQSWTVPLAAALALVVLAVGIAVFFAKEPSGQVSTPTSCAISHPSAGPSFKGPLSADMWRQQDAFNDAQTLINQVAARDEAYDTTVSDVTTNTLTIYRVANNAVHFESDYRAVVPAPIALRFAPAQLSLIQQGALSRVVDEHREWFHRKGVVLTVSMEAEPGGCYQIGYDSNASVPDPADLRIFEKFGAGTVVFAPVEPFHRL